MHNFRGTNKNKKKKVSCAAAPSRLPKTHHRVPRTPKPVLPRPRTTRLRRLSGSSRASLSTRRPLCRPRRHPLSPRSRPSPPTSSPTLTVPLWKWGRLPWPHSACTGGRRSGKLDARRLSWPVPRRRPSSSLRLPRLVGPLAPSLRRRKIFRGPSAAGSRA